MYKGECLLDEVLNVLFDKKHHTLIKNAVEIDLPFMIYDYGECGDGLLYRALKNEGVTTVRSFQIDEEMQKENTADNSAFFTVFLKKVIKEKY